MIFNLIFLILIQPLFTSFFFFLAPILNYFFKDKMRELTFNLIFLSFLTDLIFIKPLGFFLLITSFSILILCLLEKFLGHNYFYQKIIYLLLFNLIFLSLFFFLSFKQIFSLSLFLKFLIFNLFFQSVYIIVVGLR